MATEKVATEKNAPAGAATQEKGRGRRLEGSVTSTKMDKTVVVQVTRRALHPTYRKYVKLRESYKAHDEKNEYKVGDRVEITESRPLSRGKRWQVTKLVGRRAEA